jgi:hypothetical protein
MIAIAGLHVNCRGPIESHLRDQAMYFVAFVLAIAAVAFYAAGTDGIWADPLCHYGSTFCQHPVWVAAAAVLALIWAKFVSV